MIPSGVKHSENSIDILDSIWIGLKGTKLPENLNEVLYLNSTILRKKIIDLWRRSEQHHKYIGTELDGRIAVIISQFYQKIKKNL